MKLLQLNVTANWGSTGKIAEGIGQAAIARGWESYIAYGRHSNPSTSNLIKVGNKKDVYLHYAKNRLFDAEGLGSKRATKKLINQIKELKPDIIHLHNIHDHWLNYPILFDYLASIKTPIVWTFHDCWAFTGGCYHFENISCNNWKTENCAFHCKAKIKKSKRNFELRKKVLLPLQSRLNIVGVSRWLADYVKESMFVNITPNIFVLNNGIDIENAFKYKNTNKINYILGVSNVWPTYKGLPDFIELRKLLPKDIDIILVGLTENQISNLPEGIRGIQRTSNVDELADLYRTSKVFVNPTHNDSFPTVNLEALACGTPVVTYRTGGSPEAVDEKTGIVVDKGDVNALADAVMHIIENPESFKSEDCRLRAVTHFNKDVQFGKYVDLYESLLNN